MLRYLFVRNFALRVADGKAAIPGRFAVFADDRATEPAAAFADQFARGRSAGLERNYPDGHGQGARGPVPERGCVLQRAEKRAGIGAAEPRHNVCAGIKIPGTDVVRRYADGNAGAGSRGDGPNGKSAGHHAGGGESASAAGSAANAFCDTNCADGASRERAGSGCRTYRVRATAGAFFEPRFVAGDGFATWRGCADRGRRLYSAADEDARRPTTIGHGVAINSGFDRRD